MKVKLVSCMVLAGVLVMSCRSIALLSTAQKKASATQTVFQKRVNDYFWQQLHAGNYDSIPNILNMLTAAYLENPGDFSTTAHIAFTHMWAISERNRKAVVKPVITDHIILAKKYFAEAGRLNPGDARIHGFQAATFLNEGSIDRNEKEQVTGYFMMTKAIKEWPEFNYFTGGYVLSKLANDSKQYKEAMEWQWKNLDACVCEKIDRANVDFSKYMIQETTTGKKRVCWNSEMAPHNFEGFFLNMGDMLVKQGDWQTSVKIYNNAKLSKTYERWKYKTVLEERILHAQANTTYFNQKDLKDDNKTSMLNTSFSCMACHQN
jgi:hypothetical protein